MKEKRFPYSNMPYGTDPTIGKKDIPYGTDPNNIKDTKDWKEELCELYHSADLDRGGRVVRVTVVLSALERFISQLLKEAREEEKKNILDNIFDTDIDKIETGGVMAVDKDLVILVRLYDELQKYLKEDK